ncbi:AraC family transcriptional regulator [Pedobacter yulinensis]|uniref:AraC family transcriptional regulator n=1 Tax=Pedobacter yulinensis TaxID=2126353 RepID=A0A2T3HPG4_9SPHI|nr:AraC family transcriptional regulator [Pedobacter yulinensis]PST84297.1 AraC family transcriptional regulator [Pedobacter yulinensis]
MEKTVQASARSMVVSQRQPDESNSLFVKNIFVFRQDAGAGITTLPFFADGYPGLVFHTTPGGQWVQPQNKQMPAAYLYGQTLHPIELRMEGAFSIIAFQLYPFVLKSFFGVDPASLNNACFNLQEFPGWKTVEPDLSATGNTDEHISLIMAFLHRLFGSKREQLDQAVMRALQIILDRQAQVAVSELSERVHLTVRTFERKFLKETGISAKDFMQIIRFSKSLEQLTRRGYQKLTDVVYANGYSDQSHFIRVFKAFTGQTPKNFARSLDRP